MSSENGVGSEESTLLLAKATAAKEAGNAALKSADLPLAMERYEEACEFIEGAIKASVDPRKVLPINELVRYHENRFARIDVAYPHFGDYTLMDMMTKDLVKEKVSKYEEVPKRFRREDLEVIPQACFDLRLACLQNISLASLKIARGSTLKQDFEAALLRANDALTMDGYAAKALMRMSAALVELRLFDQAMGPITIANQVTKGKDPEVLSLLNEVMTAKGKPGFGKSGKGGIGKGKNAPMPPRPPQLVSSIPEVPELDAFENYESDDSEDLRIGLGGYSTKKGESDEAADSDSEVEKAASALRLIRSEEHASAAPTIAAAAPAVAAASSSSSSSAAHHGCASVNGGAQEAHSESRCSPRREEPEPRRTAGSRSSPDGTDAEPRGGSGGRCAALNHPNEWWRSRRIQYVVLFSALIAIVGNILILRSRSAEVEEL